jgi:spore germination protein YaaH/flagellar hook assembly protein FlgD
LTTRPARTVEEPSPAGDGITAAMRTALASGFRRSLARHAGRSIAALAIAAIVAQAGLAPAAPGGVRSAPQPPSITVVDDPTTGLDPQVDLAAFDPASAEPDAAEVAPPDAAAAASNAGLQPSIQYEEAVRHESDKIAFTPGGRVTVGFAPRAGDSWSVGGVRPTALPAGRLDGKAIRAQGAAPKARPSRTTHGSFAPATRSDHEIVPVVDLPTGGPTPVDATNASFSDPAGGDPSQPTIEPDARVSSTGLRREIFGFLPYWQLNSSSLRLDYAKISTIAYFGVGADGNGNLQKRNSDGSTTVGWSGWTSSKMSSIISAAHANRTRVVLTVQSFGWSTAGLNRQRQLLGSSANRLNLARQIAAAVRDRGVDGVNLDFEPLASTYDAEFTALVRTIRAELNRIQSGYQITFDTLGFVGNYPIAKATAPGGADAVFVMGYDYRSSSSSPVGSIAPLTRSGYDIRDTIAAYLARVPASKIILGVPYYGRAWSTSSSAHHAANRSGTKYGASTTVLYDTAADYLSEYGRRYDPTEGVAWTAYIRQNCTTTYGCVNSWRQLYVDDAAAISAKYDLVNRYGLRGAGIWALGYDGTRPELWAAIQRKFVTDTTPPKAGIKTLPAAQRNPGFSVTWTGRDDVSVVSYDVQASVDGRAWVSWLNATKATSAVWYGTDGHTYAFRVRARDPKGNLGAWNVTATSAAAGSSLAAGRFGVVRVDGLSIRSAPSPTAAKVGEYRTGALVAILSGPRSAGGYTWFKVAGPLAEWGAVRPMAAHAWIATSGGRVAPAKAPNATRISATLGDLGFGNAGRASVGSGAAAVAHRAFSPNGDGSGDSLAIDWTNDRAFTSLSLRVFRADGTLVGNVPIGQLAAGARQFAWNGKVGSTTLPNGRYLVSLVGSAGGTSFYNPAPSFRSASLAAYGVTIDRIAPTVTAASISGALISPNGDGNLDTVRVALAASGATRWTFRVARLTGSTVGAAVTTKSGSGGTTAVTWNGRRNDGAIAADGTYRLTLTALDNAANRVARSWTVRVDRTPAALKSTATPSVFSPNGDGTADTTRLAWSASERISGLVRIVRGTTVIRSWTVTAALAGAVGWNGTTAAGAAVPDGTYTFRVTARDAAGNLAVRTQSVVVDRTLGAVRWSRSAFYPHDGDAISPSARVSFTLKRSASVTVGIYSGTSLVRTIWTNRAFAAGPHSWTWNGRDAHGALVARGVYTVRVSARSSIGTSVVSRSILVDAFRVAVSSTVVRAGQTLTLNLTTTEALRAAPSVTFSQPGRAAVSRTATALGSGRYRLSFTIASGAAGAATIRIAGRDTAGGLNRSTRAVTIR